jgi:hypothetical protein
MGIKTKKKAHRPNLRYGEDEIKERILCVERDMGHMKDSIEFADAELRELKEEADKSKRTNKLNAQKLRELEDSNRCLQESVIDLKARSMRDNLLFFNVNEDKRENTTEKIYEILERNLEIPNARILTESEGNVRAIPEEIEKIRQTLYPELNREKSLFPKIIQTNQRRLTNR